MITVCYAYLWNVRCCTQPSPFFLSVILMVGQSKVALLLVMDQEQTMQNLSGQQKENQPFSLDPPKWLS
jgi:hypothetical protein